MMRGLLSNEEEIARRILMAHFPLPLRLPFSECIVYSNRQKYFLPIRKKSLDILKEKSLDCVRLMIAKNCVYIRK